MVLPLGRARTLTAALGLAVLAGLSQPAFAQEPTGSPFRGLFGPTAGNPAAPETLSLTFGLSGGYDDRLPGVRRPAEFGGVFTEAGAAMLYQRRLDRVTFALSGQSSMLQIPRIDNLIVSRHAVAAEMTAQLTPRFSLSLNQGVEYSPYHRLRVRPAAFDPAAGAGPDDLTPAFATAVDGRAAVWSRTSVAVVQRLTPRASLTADYQLVNYNFLDEDLDLRRQRVGGHFRYALTPYMSLRTGYGYRQYDYFSATAPATRHDIDAGVDYSRPLAISRRTVLGFGGGSSMVSFDRDPDVGAATESTYLRAHGFVTLTHDLNGNWQVQASYDQGVQFVEAIPDPFFAQTAWVAIGGPFGPRVELLGSGSYTAGGLRLSLRRRDLSRYGASARLRVALSRAFAIEGNYYYMYHWYSPDVVLPSGYPRQLDRQGVSVGLVAWLPLIPR